MTGDDTTPRCSVCGGPHYLRHHGAVKLPIKKIVAEVWCGPGGCGALPGSRCISLRLGKVFTDTVHTARLANFEGDRLTAPPKP